MKQLNLIQFCGSLLEGYCCFFWQNYVFKLKLLVNRRRVCVSVSKSLIRQHKMQKCYSKRVLTTIYDGILLYPNLFFFSYIYTYIVLWSSEYSKYKLQFVLRNELLDLQSELSEILNMGNRLLITLLEKLLTWDVSVQ